VLPGRPPLHPQQSFRTLGRAETLEKVKPVRSRRTSSAGVSVTFPSIERSASAASISSRPDSSASRRGLRDRTRSRCVGGRRRTLRWVRVRVAGGRGVRKGLARTEALRSLRGVEDGPALFSAVCACAHGLEGTVAKKHSDRYRPGEHGGSSSRTRTTGVATLNEKP
jgi:hypothetical protein